MNIEIEFVHLKQSDRIEEHVKEKLEKIQRKYNWITNAAVFLKKENTSDKNHCECQIRLSVPGPQLYAQAISAEFIPAINEAIDDLTVQLQKKKDKMTEKR